MTRSIPWPRILAEGCAIVVSILLAFGIQAWWEGRQERRDEVASLELLLRDLDATLAELDRFDQETSYRVERAEAAAEALAGPPEAIDRLATTSDLVEITRRRTVNLASAAYGDLVSTGTLRVIRDRRLRDQIVQFYDEAAYAEVVIEKNSTMAVDELTTRLLVGEGLIYSWDDNDAGGVVIRDDPIWHLAPDSREWRRVRSALHRYGQTNGASLRRAQTVAALAEELRLSLQRYLQPG